MPDVHARLCSPSSAERWLNCTASATFETQFPGVTTVYAEQGTLAHAFCETKGKRRFCGMDQKEYNSTMRKLKQSELYDDEMLKTADFYVQYLREKSMTFDSTPYIAFEVRVDLSTYIPECFGTCDCVMIGGNQLHITDYKHGKGVAVSPFRNYQMMLYALGALIRYRMFYPGIETVSMAIVQPRITEDVQEYIIPAAELLGWAEDTLKSTAKKAYTGVGAEFKTGDWCRFCKGKAACRKRADENSAFADFKDIISPKMNPPALSNVEIGELLVKAKDLKTWYSDLEDYARELILSGQTVPGYKVVEGRGSREFIDEEFTFAALREMGYEDDQLYETKPKSVAQIEKLMGKKKFEIITDHWKKVPGKPTLATADDKRPAYSPAAADFAGVTNE